ncbi:MAG: aminoglycoside phosphotransferase family protein [Lentilitoribacter sp.]
MPKNVDVRLLSAKEICTKLSIDAEGILPIRLGTNSLYHLPSVNLVARVHNENTVKEQIKSEIMVANRLAHNSVRCAPISCDYPEIYSSEHHQITFWKYIMPEKRLIGFERKFGELLVSFHDAMTGYLSNFPKFEPLEKAKTRLQYISGFEQEKKILIEEIENVEMLLPKTPRYGSTVAVHGDAHLGNVIWSNGDGYLIDFESVSIGRADFDIIPMAVTYKRFLQDIEIDTFLDAVIPGLTYQDIPLNLLRVRELTMITWLGEVASSNPEYGEQFEFRIETLKSNMEFAKWSPK